jgi:hypothetical protein
MNSSRLSLTGVLLLAVLLLPRPAAADRIVIIGSDAATFHGHTPFAVDLRDYLQNDSPLPVLLLGDAMATGAFSTAVAHSGVVSTSSLSGMTLSPRQFSAVLVLSNSVHGTGCCDSDDPRVSGFQPAISEFLGGGGTLGIQNYVGEAAYDSLLGTSGGANAHVHGFRGGRDSEVVDYDDEAVTAVGLAAGFTEYPVLGAWGHQAYDIRFFSRLGFISLIDAPTFGGFASGLMSTEAPAPIPEPSSLLLLGSGAVGVIVRARRRRTARLS